MHRLVLLLSLALFTACGGPDSELDQGVASAGTLDRSNVIPCERGSLNLRACTAIMTSLPAARAGSEPVIEFESEVPGKVVNRPTHRRRQPPPDAGSDPDSAAGAGAEADAGSPAADAGEPVADASAPVQDAAVSSADAASAGSEYDPGFRLSDNCNTWWLEVYADASAVDAELMNGERFALAPQSWGSFAVSRELPAGTVLRLHAERADGAQAHSTWFAFLSGAPALDGTPPSSGVTPGYDPGFSLSPNCNEWWLEVYADASSVSAELASGQRIVLAPQSWGSFASGDHVVRGTSLRLVALRSDGALARSRFFAYLDGSPVLEQPGASGSADAGVPDAAAPPTDAGTTPPLPAGPTGWLHTAGNRILSEDGQAWLGRGANMHDTRGCGACAYNPPSATEVMRRIDTLVDDWGANFVRLDLESYASADGRMHWQGVLDDPNYLADLVSIVEHVGEKPGVYLLLSVWADPSFTDLGWPTAQTGAIWERLAETFAFSPQVLFGLVNEPESNYSGSLDSAVWSAMNDTVQRIRDVEDRLGAPHHVVTVQGTGGWARYLRYYTTHPITAGGGVNVAYETHVYDPASAFDERFVTPSQVLPVIIGEFGPVDWAGMTLTDCATLMDRAEAAGVSYLAWTFHGRCPPNLIVDNSGGSCGIDMPLQPTPWGQLLKDQLAR